MSSDERHPPGADALFDVAACGLLLTDQYGRIQQVNRTFCRWMGYAPDELVGARRLQDLMNMGGKIFHQTHWAPLMKMQGSVAEVKLDLIRKDGQSLPFLLNGATREVADGTVHDIALFIARDRHKYEQELLFARRRAEEALSKQLEAQRALSLTETRLRLALDAGQLYVWEFDPANGQRRYDDAVAVLLGFDTPQPIGELDYSAHIHPDDKLREAEAFNEAVTQNTTYRCVYRLEGADHQVRTVLATGSGRAGDDGKPQWFVGVLHDVTELSRQRAEAEDRALFAEQMVGIVSHDLRTPLAAVRMGADLLARGTQSDRQQRLITHIGEATSRAQRLVEDLLDFTLIRMGHGLKVNRQPVDVQQLVAASVAELQLALPDKQLVFTHSGSGLCELDSDRMTQLLGNLVSNAAAYGASSRPITISVELSVQALRLAVHNEGEPIPADLQTSLFEPMVRGVGGNNPNRSVGLGLFIVKEIARAHHGDVLVQSTHDTGTTFTVALPV